MGDDVFMPDVLACGSGAHNLIEPNLWVSSGNTSSTLHKDAYNTVNCQIVGEKDWYTKKKSQKIVPTAYAYHSKG